MSLTIQSISDQYSLRIPAQRFSQGGRDVYSFALDLARLDGLLPERVDEEVVKDANRRLTVSHANGIREYLEEREDWLLGALLLGIDPAALEFLPYDDEQGGKVENFGELRVRDSHKNTMRIFDGQHRRYAINEVFANPSGDAHRVEKLRASSLPIVLYAEKDMQALRRMFVDASKTKATEANTLTLFDDRDPFNVAAVRLAADSDLFGNRVEKERTSVRTGSHFLISINRLAGALKTMEVGFGGRVSKERRDSLMLDPDRFYERCWMWADDFMPSARGEYADLINGEIENSELPQHRSGTFAYYETTIRILAGCYHLWCREISVDWKPLASFLKDSSMKRPGNQECLLVRGGQVVLGGDIPITRAQEMKSAINYIVNQAREAA